MHGGVVSTVLQQLHYDIHTAKLPGILLQENKFRSIERPDEAESSSSHEIGESCWSCESCERGCHCEVCESTCEVFNFKDAGWLRRIYLGILLIFCGCCLFTLCISFKRCSQRGIHDKCCDCCPDCCGCKEFCIKHNSCFECD